MPHLPSHDDPTLIARFRTGDPPAFESLYARHRSLAFAVASRICDTDEAAEDAVQQAFLDVWRNAAAFDPGRGSMAGWIAAIVRRRAIDQQRRLAAKRRRLERCHAERAGPEANVPAEFEQRADAASVRTAMANLPSAQHDTLRLAYDDGLSHTEIAAALRVPLGTVKSRTRLALANLRHAPEITALDR